MVGLRCLRAYRRGDETEEGDAGALLELEYFHDVHAIADGLLRKR